MTIQLYSSINSLGYGSHNCNIIKALIENGQELTISPIGEVQVDNFYEMYIKECFNNQYKYSAKNPAIYIFHDHLSNQACGNPLFVYSIFETTQLSQRSSCILTHGPADVILVTTEKHKELLSDINKPIEVVPEGVDETLFNTIPVDKYIDTKKFTYLLAGKREERKGTDIAIKNFIETMKDQEVALICHTFNPFINRTQDHPFKNLECWTGINPLKYGFEIKGIFNNKAHLISNGKCDIYFTFPTLPVTFLPSLYHSANLGISISRGEGWNLVLSESLACGLPCIATKCLGQEVYLKDAPGQKELNIECPNLTIALDNIWFKGDQGEWSIIDEEKYKELLINTYNKDKYINKNEELSNYISTNFSWNKAAKRLIEVVEQYKKV